MDNSTLSELSKTFNVTADFCKSCEKFFDETILPRLQKKYLAHLVSAVEDMVNEKMKEEEEKEKGKKLGKEEKLFYIIHHAIKPPRGNNAITIGLNHGVIIIYDPNIVIDHDSSTKSTDKEKKNNADRALRILIAHELGHLLMDSKILEYRNTDENANVLAYFAISGKNKFYIEDAPKLAYNSESEIIRNIDTLCKTSKPGKGIFYESYD